MRQSIKILLITLNIIAAVAMLLGKLTTLVSPAHWLIFAYFGLFFPFILAINFAFILFWLIFRKWKTLFISLVTCFLCINNICNTFPIHLIKRTTTDVTNRLKIMTYNIDAFSQFSPSRKSTMDSLLAFVNRKNPDVVCFQEFYVYNKSGQTTEKNVLKRLKKYPYHFIHYSVSEDVFSEGLAIFSKYPIDYKGMCQFSKGYYMTIYADIEVNSKTIRVFNHHMQSYKFTADERRHYEDLVGDFNSHLFRDVILKFSSKMNEAYNVRAKQADIVAKTIDESPYPIIICGDFNDVPVSYTYTTIKQDLLDTYATVGTGYGNTYSHKLFPFRIDYIMVDPSFHPISSRAAHVKYSDHYPVISEVGLP
ncbi:MAG: Endonuclease/exonuclease/phosphatase [Bacteroidetes bacterium]|jgi:endonuclease/exonuclease/phosphatase family metal-dependent hydrolase|nr:Endonuclease/exonuclease/phosphatase [Bacteroidota bacterium]